MGCGLPRLVLSLYRTLVTPWLYLSSGKYCAGKPGFVPSTVLGILEILKRCEVPTFGKNVCVVNRTKHLGEFL